MSGDSGGPRDHREYFDALASSWEEKIPQPVRTAVEEVVTTIGLPRGARVLDLGSGTGVATAPLRTATGAGGRIIALDVSGEMLRQARSRYGTASIDYVQADGGVLPFAGQSFDAILCNATFPHLRDKHRALREMGRVLRSGGALHITHPIGRERTNAIHQNAGGVIGQDRVPEGQEMRAMLEEAGFIDVQVVDEPARYAATGRRESDP